MGRPLNSKYMGKPTTNGNEIKVQFFNGTASVDGWIVKQLGSRRFRCSDGTTEADCKLTDTAAALLSTGEMSISVKDDAGAVTRVTKISAKKVSTTSGYSAWNFTSDITDGAVEIEEAGAAPSNAIAGSFVIGADYIIDVPGTTDFTLVGALDSITGTAFTATGVGAGDGTAILVTADNFGL